MVLKRLKFYFKLAYLWESIINFYFHMITRSRYYEPFSRRSRLYSQEKNLGLRTEKQLYLSPQPSIQYHKSRYKLVPLRQRDIQKTYTPKMEHTFTSNQVDYITHDIAKLEAELEYKRRLRRGLERPNILFRPTNFLRGDDEEEERLPKLRLPTRTQTQYEKGQDSIWQNPDIFRSTARKQLKIYKLKSRKADRQEHQILHQGENLPVIDKIRWGTSSRFKNKQYLYQYVRQPIKTQSRMKRLDGYGLRNFRKIAHVVLFTIYLRKFNQRMRRNRQGFFHRYVKEEVKQQLINLKNYFIEHSNPLFLALIQHHQFDYALLQKDDPKLKKQKINAIKKLVELEVNCLEKSVRTMANRQLFSDLIYYMCKHGNYASYYQMNTLQQLNLCCISEKYGYMRGDKYLQSSAIVSLVFIKILVFNILLQPNKIPLFESYSNSREIIFKNLALIGNILYELFIDIQDNFLQKSASVYKIGNWKDSKSSFKCAQSMTVKPGLYIKNELISGLHSFQYVKETFGTKFMVDYKNILQQLIKLIHQNIVAVHQRVRKKYF